ncbi:MAG: hypothetical protein ACOC0J_02370, partial [Myxococcota bacterium]
MTLPTADASSARAAPVEREEDLAPVEQQWAGREKLERMQWYDAPSMLWASKTKSTRPWKGKSLLPVVAFAFVLGLLLPPAARAVASSVTYEKLGIFTRVLGYVENNYVEEVDPADLVYGAIRGMLSTLDSHSAFMTALVLLLLLPTP